MSHKMKQNIKKQFGSFYFQKMKLLIWTMMNHSSFQPISEDKPDVETDNFSGN